MSTLALDLPKTARAAPAPDAKVTPRRVLRAEWVKFRTLRSSWYALAAAVASMAGIGAVIGYTSSTATWSELEAGTTAASGPLQGFFLAQLFLGVLGVLFVTGEYGTGMIRSTLAAVPKRWPVLGAKAVVFGAIALTAMTAASFAAFFAGQAFLGPDGHGSSLSDPGALRAVAGTAVYLTLVGMLGGALGWILRSTASATAALLGILMVLPLLIGFLPASVGDAIGRYMPSEAGQAAASSLEQADLLAPGAGLAVLALWVVAGLGLAVALLRRRDA